MEISIFYSLFCEIHLEEYVECYYYIDYIAVIDFQLWLHFTIPFILIY